MNLVIDPSMFPQLLLGGQLQQATTPLTTESREAKEKRRRRRRRRAKVAEKRTAAAKGDDDDELLSSGEGSSCSSDTDSDEDNGPRQAMGAGGEKERARWKAARKTVKVFAWWDIIAGLFWAAVGVWAIGFGERCTPGAFQGWWCAFLCLLARCRTATDDIPGVQQLLQLRARRRRSGRARLLHLLRLRLPRPSSLQGRP